MNLDTLIRDQNPQWFDISYSPIEKTWYKRYFYTILEKSLKQDLIIALTGLRRAGKSTLMKQVLSSLLDIKVPPQNIFYFSFDASIIKNESETLRQILEAYASSILYLPLNQVKETTYIFLDEVQIIPYWQDIIKSYYDLNPNLKFIISGSSSLFISRKSTESLAGRIKEIVILPLSFTEYLQLNTAIKKVIDRIGGLEKYSQFFPDCLSAYFEKYLDAGQFPQPVTKNYSAEETQDYLQKIEDKILEIDLPKIFPIKRPDILKIIFTYLKQSYGLLLSYENLTNDLGVDIRTTIKYIDWLKKSYLIDLCLNQTKKIVKASRTSKKIYLASTNFAKGSSSGSKVENYIFNFLKNLDLPVEFFRFQNKEIDFVVTTATGGKIPIEVKYQESTKESDWRGILDFAKKHKSPCVLLITKNLENCRQKGPTRIDTTIIYRIPASKIEMVEKEKLF